MEESVHVSQLCGNNKKEPAGAQLHEAKSELKRQCESYVARIQQSIVLRTSEGHSLNPRRRNYSPAVISGREALFFCWKWFPRLRWIKETGELLCPQYFRVWHIAAAR